MNIYDTYTRLVITIIDKPISIIDGILKNMLLNSESIEKYIVREEKIKVTDLYVGYPIPGCSHMTKVLLRPSNMDESKTLIMANLEDGWNSLGYIVSDKLEAYGIVLGFSSLREMYPANSFTYIKNGETIRHVHAMKEDKWIFYEEGNVQPFEDASTYKNRMIKKRFTPDDVVRIAKYFGLDMATDSFIEEEVESVIFEQVRSSC